MNAFRKKQVRLMAAIAILALGLITSCKNKNSEDGEIKTNSVSVINQTESNDIDKREPELDKQELITESDNMETTSDSQTEEPAMIENQGELEIVVPDDQESGGF